MGKALHWSSAAGCTGYVGTCCVEQSPGNQCRKPWESCLAKEQTKIHTRDDDQHIFLGAGRLKTTARPAMNQGLDVGIQNPAGTSHRSCCPEEVGIRGPLRKELKHKEVTEVTEGRANRSEDPSCAIQARQSL